MTRTRTFEIEGMACARCAIAIELALETVPGVASAHVNLARRCARVAASETVKDDAIVAVIVEQGYRTRRAGQTEMLGGDVSGCPCCDS